MRVAVIGTGYVGLVSGTCLAHCGNRVTCIDAVEEKIQMLQRGQMPLHEPGLERLVTQNLAAGRLEFSTYHAAVNTARLVMVCVGTPQGPTGAADLSALLTALRDIAPHLERDTLVVIKSTVPVGTNAWLDGHLHEATGRHVEVASNPEFLRQGSAIDDFMNPDRVVVGVRQRWAADLLAELYQPVLWHGAPFLTMTPESAELTKYASNALLASKIAFINEIATLCDAVGADVEDVRHAVGTDRRIGMAFLCPGAGYGGSCFPKDVRALLATALEHRHELPLISAIDVSNEKQKLLLAQRLESHFGGELGGRRIAIWGLAFKPNTDDIREAPALVLIRRLLELGAVVHVHDPQAMDNTRRIFGDMLSYAATPAEAVEHAEALAIVTDWDDYRAFPPESLQSLMATPAIFDGRNIFDVAAMRTAGVDYHPIGRAHHGQLAAVVGNRDNTNGRVFWLNQSRAACQ